MVFIHGVSYCGFKMIFWLIKLQYVGLCTIVLGVYYDY